jgi:hypothetical protein
MYRSSFPLESVVVVFQDGGRLDLVFKNVSPRALSVKARCAKPEFLDDPLREIEVYRHILPGSGLGTAECHAVVVDEAADRYWLFLENVQGRELYQIGEFGIWKRAARWLSAFHTRFAGLEALPTSVANRLTHYDERFYARWIERALSFLDGGAPADSAANRQGLQRLAACYPAIVGELLALPLTLIHGEFYASNIIVQETAGAVRVCPVDWERAAIGPGLADLAALVAGTWSEECKQELAFEYYTALRQSGVDVPEAEEFRRALDLCRLHLAVQWLGWSPDWSPPPEHRQDWLAEALDAARRLGWRV